MSASGINAGWQRDYFTRHHICPCSPEQECRWCSDAAYSSELAAVAAAVAAVTERELRRGTPEQRAS